MNSATTTFRVAARFFPALVVLFLASCATTPKIDWNSRVANYTYDHAVTELGPPDKSAKLADGSTVAEWLTRRGYAIHYPPPLIYADPWHCYGPIYPGYYDTYSPNYYLRLIFGPDGQLRSWRKFSK